jgi:hypothetical protein
MMLLNFFIAWDVDEVNRNDVLLDDLVEGKYIDARAALGLPPNQAGLGSQPFPPDPLAVAQNPPLYSVHSNPFGNSP